MADTLRQEQIAYQLKTSHSCSRLAQKPTHKQEPPWCGAEFDGVVCWAPTEGGATATEPCPAFLETANLSWVNRTCGPDATWESGDDVNYTSCGLDAEWVKALRQQYDQIQEHQVSSTSPSASPDAQFLMRLLDECYSRRRYNVTLPEGLYCPLTFDGLSCWNYTLAGETAVLPCPYFVTGFDPRRSAFRHCMEDGNWFQHPESGFSWSNYTTCVDMEDLEFRQLVNTLYMAGYLISVVALCLSLTIFFSFRSLKCTRISVHVQLFLSFASNNIMWLVWYKYVIADPIIVKENALWCQALHVLLQYLMVANYTWMFCEGLHLHLALVVVFVKDHLVMRWFHAIGWGLPLILTLIYAGVRGSSPDDAQRCWMEDSHTQWILTAPVLISMLASTVFLVNVVRILLTKLHSASANPAPVGMRKAVRATLILVPLFGIHHILIPFRPEPGQPGEQIYQVFSAVVVSLQGFCVSCLFCFANMDVHYAMLPLLKQLFGSCFEGENAITVQRANTLTHSTRDLCV
ncbi:calcitonin gene-related peptide type 1 receptor [Cryptotermes secundus]|uniref:calcitonin gene-related peptide type 1 receptor n=1 Tax=Cryptotermes secundus TaxID=105785 RepID=UPI000CD7BA2E|nr:calcitonin gene-related peptide type 1 receptor [Cryptotermes secundus]